MNDLQQHFLAESINKLIVLQRNLSAGLSENTRLEAFRIFHTIKGTAQTFELSQAGVLAHTLENLLSAGKNNLISDEDLQKILPEGAELLAKSLEKRNYKIPTDFRNKLSKFSSTLDSANSLNDYSTDIPDEYSALLSAQEKLSLNAATATGKNIFVLEIGFEISNFADGYKTFREELTKKGEIIAALPSQKYASEGKIGFRVVFATFEDVEDITSKYSAKIIYKNFPQISFDLSGVLSQIAEHGKTTAVKSGKNVEFVFDVEAENVSDENLKLIFDVFLHLTRNAIDHGIQNKGKIVFGVKQNDTALLLTVSDDGKGLDTEKIKSKAIAVNLIRSDEILSEQEISNLIFAPEFSTAENITEISGRGVGLDAVKNTVENVGGRISVKSEQGKGTNFEIFLPLNS